MKINGIYLSFLILSLCSCQQQRLDSALSFSGDNRAELEYVLNHYQGEREKLLAVEFLIENMQHFSMKNGIPVFDAHQVRAKFLIQNVDAAFESWENSSWKDEVDYETFCRYILPYRINDEPLTDWRDTLMNEYGYLIDDIDDPIEAFSKVYTTMIKLFKKTSHGKNDAKDVLSLHRTLEGTCEQRSVYIVAVLRSLGIPAAYDYVPFWGNYSTSGHAWVSYVNKGRTFTVYGNDTIAKEFNRIDGESFNDNGLLEHPHQQWDSIKRVPVVLRRCYERQYPLGNDVSPDFYDPFTMNVSAQYGFTRSVTIESGLMEHPNLYAFKTGAGWLPVIKGKAKWLLTIFKNLPEKVVYLPVDCHGEKHVPMDYPFLLGSDGEVRQFIPDKNELTSVTLRRKYPLRKQWYNRWKKVLGSTIEVSNDSLFRDKRVVHIFETVPESIIRVPIKLGCTYRYIRFHAHSELRPEIAEFKVYSKHGRQLTGEVVFHRITESTVGRLFDNDYLTYSPEILRDYWAGLDLGANCTDTIGGFEICTRHDMNMIKQGDRYELFFFDKSWVSLGEQTAQSDSLVFDNVPTGALLWLKNYSGGKEERIFTYEGGKQVWW